MSLSRLLAIGFGLALSTPLAWSQGAPTAHAKDAPTAADQQGTVEHTASLKLVKLSLSDDAGEDPRMENPLGPSKRNFRRRLEQIRAIAADPEVAGVLLDVDGLPGLAKTIDLLDELTALKAAGKRLVCYSETLGRNELMIASLADHVCVPPSSTIALEGLLAEQMYYKQLLARFDAKVEVLHIGDFKTAYENFALDGMSDGQRVTIQTILDEYWNQIVDTIAVQRGMGRDRLLALFGDLMVEPEQALAAGLIDQVAYRDEFDATVETLLGGPFELVKDYGDRTKEDVQKMLESPFALFALLPALLDPPQPKAPAEPYVAIVYATGAITSGKSASDWQGNVSSMGSETIVKALEVVEKDENCKAVVLRVNSPGGSALASDMIWRAIERVKAAGKPVISSMGSVAASGGYWISMGCTAIVAQPSTLTGSIGVVGMLPDLSATLANNGIKIETVAAGPLGDQLSLLAHGPSEKLKSTITNMMLGVYDDFLTKVSKGRKLDKERVRELAGGRVWTGRQALENGLVNELGGLSESIELACAYAGLDVGETPLYELPDPANPMEQLEEAFGVLTQARSPLETLLIDLGFGDALATVHAVMSDVRPLSADRVLAVLPFGFVVR